MKEEKLIRIANFKQACAYVDSGLQPKRLIYDRERKRMIFLFAESETNPIWEKWKHHLITI